MRFSTPPGMQSPAAFLGRVRSTREMSCCEVSPGVQPKNSSRWDSSLTYPPVTYIA